MSAILLLLTALLLPITASASQPQEITLKDGTTLRAASIFSHSADGRVAIMHSEGIHTTTADMLPDHLAATLPAPSPTSTPTPPSPILKAENIALKLVQVPGLLGPSERFRYFFRIRAQNQFTGEIRVALYNSGLADYMPAETFHISIPAGGGTTFYIDSHVGPPSHHGQFSITAFRITGPGIHITGPALHHLQSL